MSRPTLWLTQRPLLWIPAGSFPSVALIGHVRLVPRVRTSGSSYTSISPACLHGVLSDKLPW